MSARLQLNLATRPFERRRRFVVLTMASAALLVLATVVLAGVFYRNYTSERTHSHQMNTLRQEIARLDAEQKRLEEALQRPEAVDVLDRSYFLNSLIRQKAVSWTRLFMDLEKILPDRVQIAGLKPVVKEDKDAPPGSPLEMDLQLEAASDNLTGLLELSHRMEKSEQFHDQKYSLEQPCEKAGQVSQQECLYRLVLSVTYVQK
jgi:Tfp pilus assembly protein PilN